MKFNWRGKLLFFVVSYSPLILALLIKYALSVSIWNIYRIIFIVVLLAFLIICILLIKSLLDDQASDNPYEENCKIKESSNSDYSLFIMSYLIPFFSINLTFNDVIPTLFIMVFIAYIYIKSSLLAVNPVLNVLGYNLYKAIKVNENKDIILIFKGKLDCSSCKIRLIKIDDDVFIGVKRDVEYAK